MTSPDDAALLAGISTGDRAALGMAYDLHGDAAYGLAYRVLGDTEAAATVVEEAFVRLWRAAAKAQPAPGLVREWLLLAVYRRAAALQHARTPAERAVGVASAAVE